MSESLISAINQPLAMEDAERSVHRPHLRRVCARACLHTAYWYSLEDARVCVCVFWPAVLAPNRCLSFLFSSLC